MNGNGFITFLLHSPLHGFLSGSTMLITVTGLKTGRAITTPVNYVQEGDILWVLSTRERKWWRNLRARPDIMLHLRGKDHPAYAQVILVQDEVVPLLRTYVRRMPISARALNIRMKAGEPNMDDLDKAARNRLMVCIKLC